MVAMVAMDSYCRCRKASTGKVVARRIGTIVFMSRAMTQEFIRITSAMATEEMHTTEGQLI